MATSRITNEWIKTCISKCLEKSKDRKFVQTIELQIGLKDYDPAKDKRFVGSVRLPNVPRPKLKICFIADQKHQDEVKANNVDVEVTTLDALKKFNKDKKIIKKWAKKYTLLIATDSIVKQLPKIVGPHLNKIGRFPQPVTHNEPVAKKIDDIKGSIKWQLKKVTNLNVAIAREDMTEEEIRQNIAVGLNFLASLLKKQW
jgi:large subunit ribosomal protein L10Ae